MTRGHAILRGAILAGGMSRRFGSDKALADFGGTSLLKKLLGVLGNVVQDPVVIVNTPERYADLPVRRLVDVLPGCGPLGGVYTALTEFRTDAVLILTCDMPLVTAEVLTSLVAAWRPGDAAVVGASGSGLEPFPGIYDTTLTQDIASLIREHDLGMRHFLFGRTGVRMIAVRGFEKTFFNMNTPEDFAALQQLNKEAVCQCQDRWNSY
jgi:molybdopterin-guanine dinucleotide biosynthesis protein A